jgi:1,4-alpha-glucan branching enzyme
MKQALTSFGDSWQDALIYTESHDEVGNVDQRIAKRAREGKGWEMSQLAAAGTIFGRGVPMIFMGQEAGEWEQFGQDGGHWWDHRLNLDAYETDAGRKKLRHWYRKLFDIRSANQQTLAFSDINVTHVHDQNGIVAFTRGGGKFLVVLNFKGGDWQRYDVGVSGRYRELANTSWPAFNLGGYTERTRGGDAAHNIDQVPIPAYGAAILKREN